MNRCIATLVMGSMILVACGNGDAGGDTAAGETGPWRVLVDEHQTGGPIEPGIRIATEADTFNELWALVGRDGNQPAIEFDDEIVIAYTLSYPSGCEFPFIGLAIDESNAAITADYAGNEPATCAADENPYLVMVGIDRNALAEPRYALTTSVGGQAATLDP